MSRQRTLFTKFLKFFRKVWLPLLAMSLSASVFANRSILDTQMRSDAVSVLGLNAKAMPKRQDNTGAPSPSAHSEADEASKTASDRPAQIDPFKGTHNVPKTMSRYLWDGARTPETELTRYLWDGAKTPETELTRYLWDGAKTPEAELSRDLWDGAKTPKMELSRYLWDGAKAPETELSRDLWDGAKTPKMELSRYLWEGEKATALKLARDPGDDAAPILGRGSALEGQFEQGLLAFYGANLRLPHKKQNRRKPISSSFWDRIIRRSCWTQGSRSQAMMRCQSR